MNIYDLIDQKVIDYAEVVVCLFDHCNLSCAFCPQHHDETLGASRNEILSKTPIIIDWINNNARSKYFKIHIMGGELFQDVWTERGFLKHYKEFCDIIKDGIVDKNKNIVMNFVSNLVFEKTSEILNFLNENNYSI